MAYGEIHLWEFPPVDTYVLLGPNFRKQLVESAVEKVGEGLALAKLLADASAKYGLMARTNNSTISDWKNGKSLKNTRIEIAIPLWCLLEIARLFPNEKGVLEEIEKNTVAYKDHECGSAIEEPRLPILVTPEFDSIVFHLLADGNWGGYEKCAAYKQVNEKGRRNFVLKLLRVFGKFQLNQANYEKYWQVLIPSIFVKIIRKYYDIPILPSSEMEVPPQILQKEKEFLLAGLLAYIVDDGCVNNGIEIYGSNKKVMDALGEIANDLSYENGGVKLKAVKGYRTHLSDHYRLRFTHAACRKMLGDINCLKMKFLTCHLAQKQQKLEELVSKKSKVRQPGLWEDTAPAAVF